MYGISLPLQRTGASRVPHREQNLQIQVPKLREVVRNFQWDCGACTVLYQGDCEQEHQNYHHQRN